ncbi:Os11g0549635 [Oryza sativa Japonica Group]|uniref:Os11g0549635 protein n=1 Tax=Oryza sativa subsp. japonica TaxID=39947 RepID=C7J8V9_ORYSJ|nr:Os11g0549635 [Oryza sativa Japonica Group]|eukprot:NP_001176591.1 Os11g0549635 [Oryza sativa Japonica Group]
MLRRRRGPLLLAAAAAAAAGAVAAALPSGEGRGAAPSVLHAVARSSRAVYTIGFVVVDYKYSLRGLAHGSADYRDKLSEVHLRSAKKILKLCEANRGFYVKAGQFVSSIRQVPKEYSSTLSCLQDQVHRGRLNNNQEVAVKVQYPGLERRMKIDIMTMSFLSKSLSWIFPDYRFEKLLTEFERTMSMELVCLLLSRNQRSTELTSKEVLTMEFCSGYKVDNLNSLRKADISPTKCCLIMEFIKN